MSNNDLKTLSKYYQNIFKNWGYPSYVLKSYNNTSSTFIFFKIDHKEQNVFINKSFIEFIKEYENLDLFLYWIIEDILNYYNRNLTKLGYYKYIEENNIKDYKVKNMYLIFEVCNNIIKEIVYNHLLYKIDKEIFKEPKLSDYNIIYNPDPDYIYKYMLNICALKQHYTPLEQEIIYSFVETLLETKNGKKSLINTFKKVTPNILKPKYLLYTYF